jgi:UDP-2,3-diacylglucosamine pyrophosphatase LpxH
MGVTAADGVIRDHLPDDALLVFLSDTHIGGTAGSEIFESAAELEALLEDLNRHDGPVVLVLGGDFLDLLRMGDPSSGGDRAAETIARPEYRGLFAALRAFGAAPGHRVVYVIGNHDTELWWNPQTQRSVREAGLVDQFALSYSARFEALPEQLIYCEHGNQFDPTNTLVDQADPLDTPVGTHIVTELVRPIGAGVAITHSIDLRDLSYVFPLAALPEWIVGRIFYPFLGQLLRWLLPTLIVAHIVYERLADLLRPADAEPQALGPVLLEVAYFVGVLVVASAVVFLVSRRTARHAMSTLAARFPGRTPGPERYREDVAIRELLKADRPPPMAGTRSRLEIAVFISGHTHAPAISEFVRADGRTTVIANTGCWLRQLRPVTARLGAPTVFVPAFVHTHVRVQPGPDGVTVELWDHPKPAERRLPWIERAAIAGRMPRQPAVGSGPRLIARQVAARRRAPVERDPSLTSTPPAGDGDASRPEHPT